MKKLLLSALLTVGTLFSASADQILIGDAKDDKSIYMGEGIAYGADANMGIALRIPSRTLQAYSGARIIGLKVAAASGLQPDVQAEAFLSKGKMNAGKLELEEPLTTTKEYIGWNPLTPGDYQGDWSNLLFEDPYTIPAASEIKFDIYFGLYLPIKANEYAIGVSAVKQSVDKNKVFLATTEDLTDNHPTEWIDITTIPGIYNGNAAVCAILELPDENETNALSFQQVHAPSVAITDQTTTAYVYFSNDGPTKIQNFEITTTFGDDTESTQTYNFPEGEEMPVGYVTPFRNAMPLPIPVMGSGLHKMTITKVNGEENLADPQVSTFELEIIGISADEAAKHVRRPVVEQYCHEDDFHSSVYQDDIIIPSLVPFKDRFTYLPQHSDDKFGQNPQDIPAFVNGESTTLTLTDGDRLFIGLQGDINTVMMPSQTIDRSIQMEEIRIVGKTETPLTATLYPQAMELYLNEALKTPTFASVELKNEFNAETSTLNILASGNVADVLPDGEKARLALYVIEESVASDSQEFPDDPKIPEMYPDGIFTHWRVVRQMVTTIEGDELDGGDFAKTYTVELENPRWDADHMKVIALVQRSLTNDKLKCQIINSAEAPLTDSFVGFEMSTIDNIIANDAPTAIFDLQGRRLNAPMRGINIINGKKILVK